MTSQQCNMTSQQYNMMSQQQHHDKRTILENIVQLIFYFEIVCNITEGHVTSNCPISIEYLHLTYNNALYCLNKQLTIHVLYLLFHSAVIYQSVFFSTVSKALFEYKYIRCCKSISHFQGHEVYCLLFQSKIKAAE